MTQPYLFRWFRDGRDAHSPIALTEEPRIGAIVYVAGERYKIVAVDNAAIPPVVVIDTPEKGYRDPAIRNRNRDRQQSLPSTRNRSLQ